MYNSIALVDVSCLFKRTFEANPNKGAENTLAELVRISERVEHMILCLDAPPYSRKELFPDYKSNRSAPETTEVYQKRWLFQQCQERGFSMAKLKGAEGDDVVATLARIYGESCPNVWIVGADKDLAQCVTETVRQLVPAHGDRPEHFRDPAAVKEKFEVWPHQIPLFLALWGDKGDNIPGVPGIGPVKAAGLINDYKTLVGIAENLGSISGKVGEALRANWDQLALSLKLTTLDTKLPLDAPALLVKQEPIVKEPEAPPPAELDSEFELMGNSTPMPETPSLAVQIAAENAKLNVLMNGAEPAKPEPIIGKDPRADEFLRQEAAVRKQKRNADRAAEEAHEREQQREEQWRQQQRAEQQRVEQPPPAAVAPKATAPTPPKLVPMPGPVKATLRGLALLRSPFGKNQISKLPKGSKEQNNCPYNEKRSCNVCGGFHHPKMVHLDYVGHAALTDRLLECDPLWSWEPMCFAPNGLPLFDQTGGLWIRLTVCGVTRLGYGHAPSKQFQEPGAREKEVIGDALRNAAMRFGAALDLWHKGDDLHDADWDPTSVWQDVAEGA
jgi:5'-3' exonuclease